MINFTYAEELSPAIMVHSDDYISLFGTLLDIPVRLGPLFQRTASIDNRFYLPCLNQFHKFHDLNRLFYIGKVVHFSQYILLQNMSHFFRFFKQWAVGRPFERVKPFYWCLELVKILLCQCVGAGVIIDALKEINGNGKLRHFFAQVRG